MEGISEPATLVISCCLFCASLPGGQSVRECLGRMACGPLGGERRDQLLLVRRARGMSTPYAGLSLGNGTGQAMNLGWRLSLGSNAAFGIEGARRRGADDNAPDHRLMLHASLGWQSPMGRRPAKRDALGPNDSTPSMVARFVTVHLCGGGRTKSQSIRWTACASRGFGKRLDP